jgi:predicted dehydrogenase
MKFALVGCGYVADFYMSTLSNHPQIQLAGVFDHNPDRLRAFSAFHKVLAFESFAQILEDPSIELVANLTNPRSHFDISYAALQAGKHVYSEKPMAMTVDDARSLVDLAAKKDLLITSAPCNSLGEASQTIWKAIREKTIGTPRLVYAELDDGPVPLLSYKNWISESGAPWPFKDEFEVGCTLEHAGYHLGVMLAIFGPVKQVTSFASIVMNDKLVQLNQQTPDFSVACLEFASGVVGRLTCSIYAAHNHDLRIFGDSGIISTKAVWHYGSAVQITRRTPLQMRFERRPYVAKALGHGPKRVPLVRPAAFRSSKGPNKMDFCRGIAEAADSLRDKRACRLSPEWALHMTEIALNMQNPKLYGCPQQLTTSFPAVEPMPWAR